MTNYFLFSSCSLLKAAFSHLRTFLLRRYCSIPLVPEGPGFASEDSGMQCKAKNVGGSVTPPRLCNTAMRSQDRSQAGIFGYEGYIVITSLFMICSTAICAGEILPKTNDAPNNAAKLSNAPTNGLTNLISKSVTNKPATNKPAINTASAKSVPLAVVSADSIVAIVNAEAITRRELNSSLVLAQRQSKRQNVPLPNTAILERQVLERMIVERVQLQQARDIGLKVDDLQVDRALARVAEQNKMSLNQLRDQIEAQGIPMDRYREDLRTEILLVRLREREVDSRIQVAEAEIDQFLADQRPGLSAEADLHLAQILIRIPEGSSPERIAQLREKAKLVLDKLRHGADFPTLAAQYSDGAEALSGGDLGVRPPSGWPQLFITSLENLPEGSISEIVQSSNGFHIIKLVNKANKTSGVSPNQPVKQTRVRHILIRINEVISSEEARQRLLNLRQRIVSGTATFGDMARQYSVDGSASQGGELGWLYPGDTVPEFERAMDSLKIGEISEPIQTPFGWHLIMLEERRIQDASMERQRSVARATLRDRKLEESYEEWLRQLRDRAYVEIRLDPPLAN